MAAAPAIALLDVIEGIALTKGWRDVAYGLTYVLRPLLIPLIFAVAILFGGRADAAWAMAAFAIAMWISTLLMLAVIVWRVRRLLGPGRVVEERPLWLKAALPVLLVDGAYLFMTSIDLIALSFLSSPEQVGAYAAAGRLVALVAFVHFGMSWATGHHFSKLDAAGDPAEMASYARQMALWTLLPSLAAALAVIVMAPFLLSLFGKAFAGGWAITAILLAGLVARAAMGPAEQLLVMTDNQLECAYAYGWGLVANAAISFWLAPLLGGIGAAIGGAAGYVLATVLVVAAVHRRLGFLVLPVPDRAALRWSRAHA
jgi:O-antigen/teichoic acid export membrane protein